MVKCAVVNCVNNLAENKRVCDGTKFFRFPSQPEILEQWIKFTGKPNIKPNNVRMCSIHFEQRFCKEPDWRYEAYGYAPRTGTRLLKPDAIPTLHPPREITDPQNIGVPELVNTEECTLVNTEECTPIMSSMIREPLKSCENLVIQQEIATGIDNDTKEDPPSLSTKAEYILPHPIPVQSIGSSEKDEIEELRKELSVVRKSLEVQDLLLQEKDKELQEKEKELQAIDISLKDSQNTIADLKQMLQNSMPKTEVTKLLRRIFTPGQIARILDPARKHDRWTDEDISWAMGLRGLTTKGYLLLKNKYNIPMPELSTLRRLVAKLDFDERIERDEKRKRAKRTKDVCTSEIES